MLSRQPSRWRGLCPWRSAAYAAGNVTLNERVVAAAVALAASVRCYVATHTKLHRIMPAGNVAGAGHDDAIGKPCGERCARREYGWAPIITVGVSRVRVIQVDGGTAPVSDGTATAPISPRPRRREIRPVIHASTEVARDWPRAQYGSLPRLRALRADRAKAKIR